MTKEAKISSCFYSVKEIFAFAGLIGGLVSVGIGAEGAGQFFHEEQLSGHGGNPGGGDLLHGAMAQGHPEGHALPLHAAGQDAVRTADAIVGCEDDAGADGVGKAGNQRPAGAEEVMAFCSMVIGCRFAPMR